MISKEDINVGLKAFSIENLEGMDSSKGNHSGDRSEPFKFVELYNKNGSSRAIIKFGKYNRHPQFLKELVELSAMHRSLVETKANLTMGDDIVFDFENESDKEESKKAYDWANDVGLLEMREGICMDLSTYGGFCTQLAYSFDVQADIAVRSIRDLKMAHKHDFDELRLLKPIKNKFGIYKPRFGAIHTCWGRRSRMADTVTLPLWFKDRDSKGEKTEESKNFDLSKEKEALGVEKEADIKALGGRFYYYDQLPTNLAKFYPVPDYQTKSAINAIILDGELIEFDVNELRNNLTSGYIVTFMRKDWSTENPEKEDKIRQAERNLVRNDMTGSRNNGKVTIVRAEPPADGEPAKETFKVNEIPNTNTADRHNILEARKNTYILVAHGVIAPEIAGIPNAVKSGFSSDADRIVDAISNLFFTRLNKARKVVAKFYLQLAQERGFKVIGVSFIDKIPFRRKIETALLKHSFLIDEIRKMNGHAPLTEEQKEQLQNELNNQPTGKPSEITGEQGKLFDND